MQVFHSTSALRRQLWQVNLDKAMQLPEVQAALSCSKEVGINLDQDIHVMALFGTELPVVLASISTMWGVRHDRPLTADEPRLNLLERW